MDGFILTGRQQRRLERQLRSADDVRVYHRTAALLDLAAGLVEEDEVGPPTSDAMSMRPLRA